MVNGRSTPGVVISRSYASQPVSASSKSPDAVRLSAATASKSTGESESTTTVMRAGTVASLTTTLSISTPGRENSGPSSSITWSSDGSPMAIVAPHLELSGGSACTH
ncbi:hypothetical protein BB28_15870 [Mycobacteroides chelonae CCUG 47445]|nr:hypothetical protein BB28_15870 [Mycobacteroides chelonae CCUG 47445]